jgi:copper homeostasis protein (lipoprotein)
VPTVTHSALELSGDEQRHIGMTYQQLFQPLLSSSARPGPRLRLRRVAATGVLVALTAGFTTSCASETGLIASDETSVATSTPATTTPGAPVGESDGHDAQNSLDWAGGYYGRVPCADCEGIDTVLVLLSDGTYALTRTHIGITATGQNGASESVEGPFRWVDGTVIELAGLGAPAEPNRYRVEENQVRQLDMTGSIITGDRADSYVLTRMPEDFVPPSEATSLEGATWELVQLNGVNLSDPNATVVSHYIKLTDGRLSAKAGCNQLAGSYTTEGPTLRFGQIVSTKMACENMADEQALAKVLETTDGYALETGSLVLLNGSTELARLAPAQP